MSPTPAQRRAARHRPDAAAATSPDEPREARGGRRPITADLVARTALDLVAREGYEALTMRRVAAALDTGPASLYAHVVNKDDLDELLIGLVCAGITLPAPDPARWREQVTVVCVQLRDAYLAHPGLSRAAMASAPTNLDTLRVSDGLLAVLLAGGTDAQAAAWAMDALVLYVGAYCLEVSEYERRRTGSDDVWVVGRDELLRRFAALPDAYATTRDHATELTAGRPHERFDFTLALMLDGLAARPASGG